MTQQEAKAIVYLDKEDYNFPVKETQKANSDKFILIKEFMQKWYRSCDTISISIFKFWRFTREQGKGVTGKPFDGLLIGV